MKYFVGQAVQVQGEVGQVVAITPNTLRNKDEYLVGFRADNDDINFYAVYQEEQIRERKNTN